MKFRLFSQAISLVILFSTSIFTFAGVPVCPSLNALKNTPFVAANKTPAFPNMWYVMQRNNNYGSNESWDFGILIKVEESDTLDVIYERANKALSSLSHPAGPSYLGNNIWMCEYQLPFGPEAVAFSPSSYV